MVVVWATFYKIYLQSIIIVPYLCRR